MGDHPWVHNLVVWAFCYLRYELISGSRLLRLACVTPTDCKTVFSYHF